jgi:hypothetical protein
MHDHGHRSRMSRGHFTHAHAYASMHTCRAYVAQAQGPPAATTTSQPKAQEGARQPRPPPPSHFRQARSTPPPTVKLLTVSTTYSNTNSLPLHTRDGENQGFPQHRIASHVEARTLCLHYRKNEATFVSCPRQAMVHSPLPVVVVAGALAAAAVGATGASPSAVLLLGV